MMAERRMFTKKVTDDDNFMSLSSSAQALYLHLSMSADDDGFCNQVTISMFKAHASVQDLQALLEKRYIYQFENGVIVIKHWRMANALRKDRYTPTVFHKELAQLDIKKNGSYTISKVQDVDDFESDGEVVEECEEETTPRKLAYKRSALPYSFDYKIKNAFYGKKCPVCGFAMKKTIDEAGVVSENRIPTIQHNTPISHGGEHELGNISVICRQCNISIQDTETGELNAREVIETWEQLSGCRLVANCLPQDSIGKVSIEKDIDNNSASDNAPKVSKSDISEFFESIWKLYPNKKGKGQVSDSKKKALYEIGYDKLARAIERYKADLEKETWRKPQNGSTFFNSGYVDYLDENYEPVKAQPVKQNKFNNFNGRNYEMQALERMLLESQTRPQMVDDDPEWKAEAEELRRTLKEAY